MIKKEDLVQMNLETYDNANETTIGFEEFAQFLRRYKLDDFLMKMSIVTSKIMLNDKALKEFIPRYFNLWQMAFASHIAILRSNDYRRKTFDDEELKKVAQNYNQLEDPLLGEDIDNNPGKGWAFLVRLASMQFTYQTSLSKALGRALVMFYDIPKTLENPEIDIEREIFELYGVKLEDLATIATCFLICSRANGVIDMEMLKASSIPEVIKLVEDGTVQKILDDFSISYEDYRDYYEKHPMTKGYEQYSFNLLRLKPIVITEKGEYVIPVMPFLMEKASTGIYYRLMDHHKLPKSNPFLIFFGKYIFETYIGKQLAVFTEPKSLFEEFQYGKHGMLTTDWSIIEGASAVLIECKTSGLSINAKTTGDLEKIKEELKSRVVKGLKQMVELREKISIGTPGLEPYNGVKDFHFVVVTYDDIYLANSNFMRKMINEELQKLGITADFKYDVLSMNDIEALHSIGKKYSLAELLKTKHSQDRWVTMDMIPFLRDYLNEEDAKLVNVDNPLLTDRREEYRQFFKDRAKE